MLNKGILKTLPVFVLVSVFIWGCLDPFAPNVNQRDLNVLVVDGYINAGPGKTRIALSKLSPLSQSDNILQEEDAYVTIESDANESYPLTEVLSGIYESEALALSTDKKYGLYIKLANGNEYRSELLDVKVTPPIDTITWAEEPNQLTIYANTHDQTNATVYYKWWSDENWEIRVKYLAYLKYNGDTVILREEEEPQPRGSDTLRAMSICFKGAKSSKLNILSTAQQVNDSVKHPVRALSYADEQIQVRYSMLLYQRALTRDEYNYLTLMEKNSTQMGSFFDPMPSQLFGNIHRTSDSEETVVGYVGVYTTVSKRLFLHGDSVSRRVLIQEKCEPVDFRNTKELLAQFLGGKPPALIPYKLYNLDNDPFKPMVQALPRECMDCRSSTTIPRPSYWREFFLDP